MRNSSIRSTLSVLLAGLLGACGAPDPTLDGEDVGSREFALASLAGPYGLTSGTATGPGTEIVNGNPVMIESNIRKVEVWSSTNYIYGMMVYWPSSSKMYGSSANGAKQTFNVGPTGSFKKVEAYVQPQTGELRGLRLTAYDDTAMTVGYFGGGTIAFDNARWVNLSTTSGTIALKPTLWGISFYYLP